MTRITNVGRKRKYLEAGFATETTTTSNEHLVPEVNTDQGDSVHPKKKRKNTKKPKIYGGDEQTPGGIEAERDMSVQGKGEGPSVGRKKVTITKKRGGPKSGHLISSFHHGSLIDSCQVLQLVDTRSAPSNVDSREYQIDKLTRYVLRVAKRAMPPRTVQRQAEKAGVTRIMSTPLLGCVTGMGFPSEVSLTSRRTGVVRPNTRYLAARSQKILSTPSLLPFVSSAHGRAIWLQRVRKTKRRVSIPTEEAVSSAARKRILQKTANFGRKMCRGWLQRRSLALGVGLVQMRMTSMLSSEKMLKYQKTRRRKTGGESGST